jgi:hypothetical protein
VDRFLKGWIRAVNARMFRQLKRKIAGMYKYVGITAIVEGLKRWVLEQ